MRHSHASVRLVIATLISLTLSSVAQLTFADSSTGNGRSVVMAVSQAHADSSNIAADPSYRNYLRWNGFSEGMAPMTGQAGTASQIGAQGSSVHAQAERSYNAYLRLNGFSVADASAAASAIQAGARTEAGDKPSGKATGLADPSYIAYERLNGLR